MVTTVLSAKSSGLDFATANMLARIQEQQQKRIQARQEEIAAGYQTQVNELNREQERWRAVGADIAQATSLISGNLGRARSVLARIEDMIRAVNKAEQNAADPNAAMTQSAAFDSMLRSIEAAVGGAKPAENLLGKSEPTVKYITGIDGGTASVSGAYIGVEYSIIDTGGKKWVADQSARLLRRYDAYPDDPTAESGNFSTGIRLDGVSGTQVDFTIAPDTADPKSFSGTLSREGIELVNAWYYDGLESAGGRARALADLQDAKEAAQLEVRRYEVAMQVGKYYEDRANANISDLQGKAGEKMVESAQAVKAAQDELVRQYQVAVGQVARSIALKNQYAKLLGSAGNSKLARALMNITA